jgi:hypothetical protein
LRLPRPREFVEVGAELIDPAWLFEKTLAMDEAPVDLFSVGGGPKDSITISRDSEGIYRSSGLVRL